MSEGEVSIYVGGLSYDITEDYIRSTFEEFGDIDKVKLIQGHDGQCRGYGFITFANSDSASAAIYGMNGKVLSGRTIRVNEVKNRTGRDSYSYRRDRDDRMRDRYRSRGRYSPKRRRRDRSPYYRRNRSPQDETSRSASPSPVSSYDRYDSNRAEKKSSKDYTSDGAKVKEGLAKALESQRDRIDQVSSLQNDLNRANKSHDEMQTKYKSLEQSLANITSVFNSHLDYLRQMKKAFADVKTCKERLRLAEHELEVAFADTAVDIDTLDPPPPPHSNGDIKYLEGPKCF